MGLLLGSQASCRAALLAHLRKLGPWRAYADWLATQDDPRVKRVQAQARCANGSLLVCPSAHAVREARARRSWPRLRRQCLALGLRYLPLTSGDVAVRQPTLTALQRVS